ncbi:MAG: 2-aminoethylphosphonate--pyruvate transaminase [Verrucomicrobia bacterium]|nr:2-aminoethylphosphonate--pyruvate transaminase [Verrucomicrobiota bacterium]
MHATLPWSHDKLLFTPGPLTTSLEVKASMLHDAGSWHYEFNARVKWIRDRLLEVAGRPAGSGWEAVLLQGSGTFGIEAVFLTCVPPEGEVVVLANGAYGERAVRMLEYARIRHRVLRTPEDTPADPAALERLLGAEAGITHVMAVHCETTSGILNPIAELGEVARRHGRAYMVDAMSSFGALPIDLEACGIDYLVSSANKCLEGVPGFSLVLCRRSRLLACEGWARSLSMDLLSQWRGFEQNGQFRYTPPTHALLAFARALEELELEGGAAARLRRYQRNHAVLMEGTRRLGLRPYLRPEVQSPIITSFHYPADPRFRFEEFYRRLSDKGFIIYPGKISQVNLFRIGTIGRLFETDLRGLVQAMGEALSEMGVSRVGGVQV